MTDTVSCDHWTDEWKPTAPATMSPRQAATEILAALDWSAVIERIAEFDEGDPLIFYGLRAELYDAYWLDSNRRWPRRFTSHLTAWVTSRMRLQSWCANDDHHDGDMIPFNDCFHGDDDGESSCEWRRVWAVMGDPDDFLRLAMTLLRDGWTP